MEKYFLCPSLVQLILCTIICSWCFLRTGKAQNWVRPKIYLPSVLALTVAKQRCPGKTCETSLLCFFQLPVICCSEGSWSKPGFCVSCNPQWIYIPWVSSHTPLKSIWTCFAVSDLPPISFIWCSLVLILEGETNNSSQRSLSLLCMTSRIVSPVQVACLR